MADRLYYGRQTPPRLDRGGRLPVALAFPGPERLALSTLGWQAVYRILAGLPTVAVERFFLGDGRPPARSGGESPGRRGSQSSVGGCRSVDTGVPLAEFPVVAVSLNFEEEYLSLMAAMQEADIAPAKADRSDWPLVLAGGPLAWLNPAPIAPAVDMFWVGEAEAGLEALFKDLADQWLKGHTKESVLAHVARWPGVYVPGLSATPVRRVLASDRVRAMQPAMAAEKAGGQGEEPADRILTSPASSCFISPAAEFRDMLLVEVNRGCPYGCRFCAAGYIYRPPRQASEDELRAIVEQAQPRKVGLVGTALTDWPRLRPFLEWLHERNIAFSLSSLRADGLTEEFLAFLRKTGLRTVTLALEAPSERLRRAANKRLRTEDMLTAVENCARLQINHLKLYLIIGWPGEADADYEELKAFLVELEAARKRGQGKRSKGLDLITLSLSPLVPKPWTPLQWAPMATAQSLEARIQHIKDMVRPYRGLKAEADSVFSARLQGYLARADESAFPFIIEAASVGGWRRASRNMSVDFSPVLDREWGEDEPLVWEVVDAGVNRAYLWREWQRYLAAAVTPACPAKGCGSCPGCGA